MYRFRVNTTEPEWHSLPVEGARIKVLPITSVMWLRARAAVPEGADEAETVRALVVAIAQQAIVEWEGIGTASGEIAEVAPHAVADLLSDILMFREFEKITAFRQDERDAEKNV